MKNSSYWELHIYSQGLLKWTEETTAKYFQHYCST